MSTICDTRAGITKARKATSKKHQAWFAAVLLFLFSASAMVTMPATRETFTPLAKAKAGPPLPFPTCVEYVYPYNPTGTIKVEDKYINIKSEAHCEQEAPYSQHSEILTQADLDEHQVTQAAINDNIHIPGARHYHDWFANSEEDADNFYETYVAAFRIYLEPDGVANMKLNQLRCPIITGQTGQILKDFEECKNGAYDPNSYGGVTLQRIQNGNEIVLTWRFGVDDATKRPKRAGINKSIDITPAPGYPKVYNFNTEDPEKRRFSEYLSIFTEDVDAPAWTGTTTSEILIMDAALKRSNVNNYQKGCSQGGWCPLDPNNSTLYPNLNKSQDIENVLSKNPATGQIKNIPFYWHNIGTVVSVWRPTVPPPPEATCIGLDYRIIQNGVTFPLNTTTGVNVGAPMSIQVFPDIDPANASLPLNFHWIAKEAFTGNVQGSFKDLNAANPDLPLVNGRHEDNDPLVFFTGGKPLTIVFVQAVDPITKQEYPLCKNNFGFPKAPELPVCTDLIVTPDVLTAPGTTNLTATAVFSDGQAHNTTVQWTGVNGVFQNGLPIQNQTQLSSTPFTNTFNAFTALASSVTVKVVSAEGALTSPVCQKTITPERIPLEKECLDEEFVLTSVTGVLPPAANESSVLQASGKYSDGTNVETLRWTTTAGSLIVPAPGQAFICGAFAQTGQDIVVPATCNVLFSGGPEGTVVSVSAVPEEEGNICHRQFTVPEVPPPGVPFCTDLDLSPNTVDPNDINTLTGVATFSDGNTYVVDVLWSGVDVEFTNDNDVQIQNNVSSAGFSNTFEALDNNGSVQAQVIGVNDPDVSTNFSQCVDEITWEVPEVECEDLDIVDEGDNEFCAEVDPSQFEDDVEWDITGGADIDTFDGGRCVTVEDFDAGDELSAFVPGHEDQCSDELTLEEECEDLELVRQPNGDYCVEIEPEDLDVDFVWDLDGDGDIDEYDGGRCVSVEDFDEGDTLSVYAEGFEDQCQDEVELEEEIPGPPDIEKRISTTAVSTGYRTGRVTIPVTQDTVYYQITFTPTSNNTTATIVDTISEDGQLTATLLPADAPNKPEPGTFDYNDDMTVREQGYGRLEECSSLDDDDDEEHCYEGDIGFPGGLTLVNVDNEVTIEYSADVDSALTDEVCQAGYVCQERYVNQAEAIDIEVELDEEIFEFEDIISNEITVNIYCQYILSRAAGDIFLESELAIGVDISKCARFKTVTGVVITPGKEVTPTLVKTGAGQATMFTIGHEICSQGQAGTLDPELKDLYGEDVVRNISSNICEVRLRTDSVLTKEHITNSAEKNKAYLGRWGAEYTGTSGAPVDINLISQEQKDVYHIKGDAKVSNELLFPEGEGGGAKTYIIEGDLLIDENIKYTGACNPPGKQCTVKDTASIAWIVFGNVYVDKDVTELAGVFYVQQDAPGTGFLYSYEDSKENINARSEKSLVIHGSVYGDIEPLFKQRVYAGDPSQDAAGIVIRYDQRVILNTPPGLRDVLTYSESEVAR